MEIDVTSVLTSIYDNWPKIRQVSKTAPFKRVSCARTGPERLVGLVQEVSASLSDKKGSVVPCFPGKVRESVRVSFNFIDPLPIS